MKSVIKSMLATLMLAGATGTASADILGLVWTATEMGWQGTWQRVGNSNRFEAIWTNGPNQVTRAELTMAVVGNSVSITRRDTFGNFAGSGCVYTGTIDGPRAYGQYKCDWAASTHSWQAMISGQ